MSLDPSTSSDDSRAPTGERLPPGASMPGPAAEASPSAVPRYRPLCLLGHGGMGSVEAVAEDMEDGTTRVVALKRILRTPGTDASRLEMFLREARLTTLLSHPNVIRSLAYGESAGEVFLAMEYIAGEPLSRIIAAARERGEPLPLPVIAFVLAEACEGLHAAHELKGPNGEPLGVVHRDVSPHNVMVGYDGTVKLLDFGVAKIDLVDYAARTKTGEVKGKTAYMSPEQAMGEDVDRRSDLYSVGAVLFECVTGRRMWGAGTDFDVLRRLALEDAPRLVEVAPETPSKLAALHAQLIERDRSKRPATALEVARELRAHAMTPGSGTQADASTVRATMTHLFEGERQKREAIIEQALHARTDAESTRPASQGSSAGESGPVFVTHHGLATSAHPRRGARVVVSVAAALAVLGSVVAFAIVPLGHRSSGHGVTVVGTESPQASAPGAPTERPVLPSTTVPLHMEAPPLAADTALPVNATSSPKPIVRRVATPRLTPAGGLAARSETIPAKAAPSSTAIPAPPAKAPEPPEPPDVDPTPF